MYATKGYKQFHCLMGQCNHTCCAGWEIDIDDESLARYRCADGAIGQKLREKIDWQAGCFRLEAGDRCPFLTKEGLCELILEMGENSLCQICADHPRYRNFLPGRVEIGLGLCCEAAARLMLTRKDRTELVLLEDDGQEETDGSGFLRWRERLLDMAWDRTIPVAQRVDRLMADCGASIRINPAAWAESLLALERLDAAWEGYVKLLLLPEEPVEACWELPLEQLLVCLMYRHLASALEDGDPQGRAAYCCVMWRLLRHMFSRRQTLEGLLEIARLYSSEIEYSDENVDAVMEIIDGLLTENVEEWTE